MSEGEHGGITTDHRRVINSGRSLSTRSASPAKRPAADMDGTNSNNLERVTSSAGEDQRMSGTTPGPDSISELNGGDTLGGGGDGSGAPSMDEQVHQVSALIALPLDEGSRGFVVSNQWLQRVLARTTEHAHNGDFSKDTREGDVGPVDNSSVVPEDAFPEYPLFDLSNEPFVPLLPGLILDSDFRIVPEKAWKLILGWYGLRSGQRPIIRYAHNTAELPAQNIIFELYPPIYSIHKTSKPASNEAAPTLSTATNISSSEVSASTINELRLSKERRRRGQASPDDPIKFVSSRKEGFQKFLLRAKEAASIPLSTEVKIWKTVAPVMEDDQQVNDNSEESWKSKLVVTEEQFRKLMTDSLDQVDVPDATNNEKYNGKSTMDMYQLFQDETLILEESRKSGQVNNEKKARKVLTIKGPKAPPAANSGRSSPTTNTIMTRGRARRDGRTRGTVGLVNLGNTCYMNSALQCIRSVEELSYYFLTDRYKSEINAGNPLGHGGIVAKHYAGVLNAIYGDSTSSAYSPSNFKRTLGQVQPLFSGYGQQDSQEFLSFLVDALHEDLNRIQKKPYNENPDSDDKTVHDPQAIIDLGEIYRKNHKARNDSVAMDLFSGFYKNTMECPVCDKISITFDPYSLITLQLPIENTFRHTITFVPLNGPPVNQRIDIDKSATIKTLKLQIASKHAGVDADRLWMVEVYSHKVYKVIEDGVSIAESNIQANDNVFVYELEGVALNGPQPSKSRYTTSYTPFAARVTATDVDMDSTKADRFAVPVFSRKPSRVGTNWELVLHPLYICLTREEAKDYSAIVRKILKTVSNITSTSVVADFDAPGWSSEIFDDAADADDGDDANGDGVTRVSDTSVPSEDDYVEVSLSKKGKTRHAHHNGLAHVEDTATKVHRLFRPRFFKSSEGIHCTGLSVIDNSNNKAQPMDERVQLRKRRDSDASDATDDSQGSNADQSEESNSELIENDVDGDSNAPSASFTEINSTSEDVTDSPSNDNELPDAEDQADVDESAVLVPSEIVTTDKDLRANDRRRNNGKANKFGAKRKNKDKARVKKERKMREKAAAPPRVPRSAPASPTDDENNPYYIRLGEGIVIDWTKEGFDALFGATSNDDDESRGRFLSHADGKALPMVEDPLLEAQLSRREARKVNGITLDDCFTETGKREILSEDNAWYCNRCKEMRQAAKTLEIWTIPEILIVHLKRFGGNRSFRDKIDVKVDYPIEGLDMTERIGLKEDGKEYIYDLFAVDNHFGGLGGGHYTAMAKNFYDGQWYDYNDSSCSKLGEKRIHSAAAYLLFYRRRSDTPLGPQYLQDIVTEARNPVVADSGDDDDEATAESGEGRLGGPAFSLHGSSSVSLAARAEAENRPYQGLGVGAGVVSHPTMKMLTMKSEHNEHRLSDGSNESWHDSQQNFIGPLRPPHLQAAQFGNQGSDSWGFDNLVDRPVSSGEMTSRENQFEDDNMSTAAAENDSTRGSMDGSDTEMPFFQDMAKYCLTDNPGDQEIGRYDTMHVNGAPAQRSPTPTDIIVSDTSMD